VDASSALAEGVPVDEALVDGELLAEAGGGEDAAGAGAGGLSAGRLGAGAAATVGGDARLE
jgi:hypothetical protein